MFSLTTKSLAPTLRQTLRTYTDLASRSSMTIAVTGSTGYIGSFVVAELLSRGYKVHCPVRGSVKNLAKAEHLMKLKGVEGLKVFDGGDLDVQGSFDAAFEGCDAVVHTAATVVLGSDPKIVTASVSGTMNVLTSVDKYPTITRFVQTSSVASIQKYGADIKPDKVFDESDWNDWSTVEKGDAYGVAKTTAEKLVHKHFENDKRTSIACNPGVVIGPVMTKLHSKASAVFLRDAIYGNAVNNFPCTFVDVRDVATGHVNALEKSMDEGMKGTRYILVNDRPADLHGALVIGPIAEKLFPGHKFEIKGRFSPVLMSILRPLSQIPFVGGFILNEYDRLAQSTKIEFSNKRARKTLGMQFRSMEVSVKEGIESMVDLGLATLRKK